MEIEKEKKVFKVLFNDPLNPKEFIFAEDFELANAIASKVFAHRKIIKIEEIELCG
jgi:hypothetical protein